MSNLNKIKDIIEQSIKAKQSILANNTFVAAINKCADEISKSFTNGNKLLLCGNGGSAADAQHIAAEFSGRFYKDRKALPAEALHVNTSYLTSVGNDYGFDVVYSRMIEGIGNAGDVLIAISTSGNSDNIVKAMQAAKEKGMTCIALTGESGGSLLHLADITLNVPSTETPRIQEAHILIGHIICQLVEEKLF